VEKKINQTGSTTMVSTPDEEPGLTIADMTKDKPHEEPGKRANTQSVRELNKKKGSELAAEKLRENMSAQETITTNGTFSDPQRFVQALCDSMAVVTVVLTLVIVHMFLIFSDIENKPFEIFATVFFLSEVSIRIWAHTPYYFFMGYNESCSDMNRWINCIDFSLSLMDIIGIILENAFAGNAGVSAGAKSARITRVVRGFKLVRTLRMWRIIKVSSCCAIPMNRLDNGLNILVS
jgi:hypothetical protein